MLFKKLLTITILINTAACSYISDSIERTITKRASFSVNAEKSGGSVIITWNRPDMSEAFAGFEIYRTDSKDDEYAGYTLVASKYRDEYGNTQAGSYGSLNTGTTSSFTDNNPPATGTYYYRVGIIHWDKDKAAERTEPNGYNPGYTESTQTAYETSGNYNVHTDINEISGYAQVDLD